MPNISEGSLVRLSTGGPVMSVKHTKADGRVFCEWRGDDGVLRGQSFRLNELTTVARKSDQ